jgi:hypothetical protein
LQFFLLLLPGKRKKTNINKIYRYPYDQCINNIIKIVRKAAYWRVFFINALPGE